jgi:hypothetical protein
MEFIAVDTKVRPPSAKDRSMSPAQRRRINAFFNTKNMKVG